MLAGPTTGVIVPTLDANLVLRWLLDDIPSQTNAVDQLLSSGEQCYLPDVALIEAVFVLERSLGLTRDLVADYLGVLIAHGSIALDRRTWHQAADHYRAHPKLSIADCYLAAHTAAAGTTPLYTFDKKLATQLDGVELLPA